MAIIPLKTKQISDVIFDLEMCLLMQSDSDAPPPIFRHTELYVEAQSMPSSGTKDNKEEPSDKSGSS